MSAKTASVGIQKNKKRIAWIDIAKGFTILTVIWGYTLAGGTLARQIICSFHMPLFFLLSGYTMKRAKSKKDLIDRTKKDFMRLIVPVIIILVIESLLNILLRHADCGNEIRNMLYKLFWSSGLSHDEGMPSMGMPWFLVSLFLAKLILRILSLVSKKDYQLMGILLGFLGVALGVKRYWLPFSLDVALVALMFISVGMLARKYSKTIKKYRVPIFIASTFFVYSVLRTCGWVDFAGHMYNLTSLIEGFAASFIFCVVCRYLSSLEVIHKVFCLIGVNTMTIFFIHSLDGFYSFLYANDNVYIKLILRTFFALLFSWMLIWLTSIIKKTISINKRNAIKR